MRRCVCVHFYVCPQFTRVMIVGVHCACVVRVLRSGTCAGRYVRLGWCCCWNCVEPETFRMEITPNAVLELEL